MMRSDLRNTLQLTLREYYIGKIKEIIQDDYQELLEDESEEGTEGKIIDQCNQKINQWVEDSIKIVETEGIEDLVDYKNNREKVIPHFESKIKEIRETLKKVVPSGESENNNHSEDNGDNNESRE